MHTANWLSQWKWARVALPGFLVISVTLLGVSFKASQARFNLPSAATILVNDSGEAVANDGKCTLREAIIAANSNTASGGAAGECAAGMVGADNIEFALGTSTPVISLTSQLPQITEPIRIKGNSGGATRVELNGASAGAGANGLTVSGGNSSIERLVVNRFSGDGVRITGGGFNTVKGCILGLDSSGTIVRANNIGLAIRGSSDNVIGSKIPGERNIISGNTTDGALVINNPAAASRNKFLGNYIGTDVTGRFDLGNTGFGVNVSGGNLTIIGGTDTTERNIVSGNDGGGIRLGDVAGANNKVIGNYIGLDISSTFALGNGVSGSGMAAGVLIENAPNNQIGGTADGEFNYIRNNNQSGVVVLGNTAVGNRILSNSISGNAGLGIDLGNDGVTMNDGGDGDTGPNNRQNSPVLSSVLVGSSSTLIIGTLNSLPSRSFRLEFFYNGACDSGGAGEGLARFGSTDVTTNGAGVADFTRSFDTLIAEGQFITATATLLDIVGPVETSEFSSCLVVPGGPDSCDATLNPPAKLMRAPGGDLSVEVSQESLCGRSASSSVPWATIISGSPGLGSGTVVVRVAANTGASRLGQLTIAGEDFFISQEGPCTASVNPPVQTIGAAGGVVSTELTTGAACAWTVTSAVAWVTVTTASNGFGATVVDFSVAANSGPSQRTGVVMVAGQTFIINQDATCTATINPTNQELSSSAGNSSVAVTVAPGCNWTATTSAAWISINSGASGSGNGTVNYSVTANPGGQRSGSIVVAGKTLSVLQSGGCSPTLDPTSKTLGSSAGTSSVNVSIGAACNWTVSTSTPWITISSPANNTGPGTVNYSVTANPGTQRNGSISIAGQTFQILQDGDCTYSISPSIRQFQVEGGTSSTDVSVASGCSWMATTAVPWITITSGASGSGNGTVNFSVATNGTGSQRSGTISVAGKSLSVTQDGGCTYTVSPTAQSIAAAGGSNSASVTTTSGCAWLATSNVAWINITSSLLPTKDERFAAGRNPAVKNGIAGTGNGSVAYTVSANTGGPRTGTMNIAGTTFTVSQASGCPVNISPANLPAAMAGVNYSQQLTQSGAVGAVNWTLSAGSLPSGMTLNPTSGLISGVPAVTANFSFTVRATGTDGCYGEIPYVLMVSCPSLSIAPTTLNTASLGTPYSQTLSLTGGSGVINWVINAGALPLGMTLNPSSGVLSGSPGALGMFSFTVRGTISSSGCFAEKSYMLTINCPAISVGPPTIIGGNLGVPYSQQFTQSGGTGNVTWSLTGSLPNGITLTPSGLLSGTPVMSGSYPITVRATGGNQCFGETAYTLQIGVCAAINVTPNTLPNGLINTGYNQALTASGGTPGYSFAVTSGALPNGVTLSASGILAGASTVVGSFSFAATVTDQAGCSVVKNYTLQICGAITVNPETLPNGTTGSVYNQTLTAFGGTAAYSFSHSGALPTGLTLTSAGILSGTPTAVGTFTFSVTAMDANSCTGSRNYTVVIGGSGLMFYPLPRPIRLLDTRAGATGCDLPGQAIPGGTSRTQTSAGRTCDGITIPVSARALTGNITTVGSGGGYLTLYPSDATKPTVANSNYQPNEILNNVFTVGLGAGDGAFKIFVTSNTHLVVDVTGYYAPPGAGGLYFHPLPRPIRLLETRAGQTGCEVTGTPLVGGFVRSQQARIACDGVAIPTNAAAIVGNATVVSPGGLGYLTLYPGNAARPLVASSNFGAGQLMNAPFTVGLSPDGTFNIYSTTITDLVVDVLGYYSPNQFDQNGAGLLFNPLPRPVRLLETRAGFNGCYTTGTPLGAGSTRGQQAGGVCDGMTIPASAQAIVGNATVVNPQTAGYLTFWPGDAVQPVRPLVATSNFLAGGVFNRHFTVGLDTGAAFRIFTSATTDLVIDVSGYFAP
ncbi:MAG: beta strand repeat-containing protein [Blastocatellia bacterium]